MDAGIASEANLVWLKLHSYNYVIVSRKPHKQFDPAHATEVQPAGEDRIQVQRAQDETSGEILLYCYSPARAEKDRAIDTTKAERFKAALAKLVAGLAKPRDTKNAAKIQQRVGPNKNTHGLLSIMPSTWCWMPPARQSLASVGSRH